MGFALVAVGCGGAVERTALTPPQPGVCAPRNGEATTVSLFRCAATSIAYVSNFEGTGTGVTIERDAKRYLLTNLHVVDPFNAADVTYGDRTFEALPVIGVDALTDIAVLGPLIGDDLPTPIPLGTVPDDVRGSRAYLVGYPGEPGGTNDRKPADLEATVSEGIVSRLRTLEEFGLHFLQTDATIAGGQSGGAMFGRNGDILGISGLSFADKFGLALSIDTVKESIERIMNGKGSPYANVPLKAGSGGAETGTAKMTDAPDAKVLILPRSDGDRTVTVTIADPKEVSVLIESLVSGDTLAQSSNADAIQAALDARSTTSAESSFADVIGAFDPMPPAVATVSDEISKRETAPGVFTVPVGQGDGVRVVLGRPLAQGQVKVDWSSTEPLVAVGQARPEQALDIGKIFEQVFSPYDDASDLLVDLTAGQEVELYARSPIGDLGLIVFGPGADPADPEAYFGGTVSGVVNLEDTDDGLYGVNARRRYKVKDTGKYRVRMYSNDSLTEIGRFSIVDCATPDACKDSGVVGELSASKPTPPGAGR